jgi:L-ascorbate metabolism protein UlaG (beta-lactamase superfamily)
MNVPVTCLGQCGFRFQFGKNVVYTDPYLSNRVADLEGNEMQRLIPVPIEPGEVTDAGFVFITHAHMDHCDLETLVPLSRASDSCQFVCPNEVSKMLQVAGIASHRIIVANDEWLELGPQFRVMPVPAAHPTIEADEDGYTRCLGYVLEYQGRRFYHAGDGSPNDRVIEKLNQLKPIEVAFIPVNEKNYYRDKRGIIGNMSVREAFQLAVDVGVDILVPTHWDMFALNCVYREELELLYKMMSPMFEMRLNPEYL